MPRHVVDVEDLAGACSRKDNPYLSSRSLGRRGFGFGGKMNPNLLFRRSLLELSLLIGIGLISIAAGSVAAAEPEFVPTGSMSVPRVGNRATLLQDGRVLITGGDNSRNTSDYLASSEVYDPSTGEFSSSGSMTMPRGGHTATLLLDGRVLVTGGMRSYQSQTTQSAEIFDPKTGQFSPVGDMTTRRMWHNATLLDDGKVLIAGGYDNTYSVFSTTAYLSSAEIFDPATSTFSPTGSMSTKRIWFASTKLNSGKVLVAGGSGGYAGTNGTAELYDPTTGTFSTTGGLITPRWIKDAIPLLDQRVLVAGGSRYAGGDQRLSSAELYDPVSGAFATTGSMSTRRQGPSATALQSGKVLVAGGFDGSSPKSSAEVYDPATGTFSLVAWTMSTPRYEHTGTLLTDGSVLIAGGWNGQDPLASAELYVAERLKDDHGNSPTRGTPVGVDSRTPGIIGVEGDSDFFRVDVGTPGVLTVLTSGDTDTYGYLYDSGSQELARRDDRSTTDKNFQLRYQVGVGRYYIQVKHALPNATGAYTLIARFQPSDGTTQRVVLLLHGLNSGPYSAWDEVVQQRWSGHCPTIFAGVMPPGESLTVRDTKGAACARVQFGHFDSLWPAGVEGVTCASAVAQPFGCKGDFTPFVGASSLSSEVEAAVVAIRNRLGSSTEVLLFGHSRGGLAGRGFLQTYSQARSSAIGLITMGTPHLGSPLGRVNPYLRTYCLDAEGSHIDSGNPDGRPRAWWAACEDDWEAAEFMNTESGLNLGNPGIGYLAGGQRRRMIDGLAVWDYVVSSELAVLNRQAAIDRLPNSVELVYLKYSGVRAGHLQLGYSAWDRSFLVQRFDQFSDRSRNYSLCLNPRDCPLLEDDPAYDGDGIVALSSQAIPGRPGLSSVNGQGVYHIFQTERVDDVDWAIGQIVKWQ